MQGHPCWHWRKPKQVKLIIYIGTGISKDFNAIFKIIKEEMHSDIEARYVKNPFTSYQMFTMANIEKARKELQFEPEYDIRAGVKRMLQ